MSLETYLDPSAMDEARRQVEICNACRYCEGYCSVFPAAFRQRAFTDGDPTQLANLCHNCRGCFYACQYTEPHEFALNLQNCRLGASLSKHFKINTADAYVV